MELAKISIPNSIDDPGDPGKIFFIYSVRTL